MNITQQNFINLLRSGAFLEEIDIFPMSAYKWRQIASTAEAHQLSAFIKAGIDMNKSNNMMNIPESTYDTIANNATTTRETNQPAIANSFLEKRFNSIKDKERHSIDTSVESLQLLSIIIDCASTLLNSHLNLKKVVEIGMFLRQSGNKVDFIKIEKWLNKLHLRRIAQLIGSVLIDMLGFAQDEIPFVNKIEIEAEKLAINTLGSTISPEEWHFKQSDNGFVVNNSRQFRRHMKHSLSFLPYAPILSITSFATNFVRSLKEIEE